MWTQIKSLIYYTNTHLKKTVGLWHQFMLFDFYVHSLGCLHDKCNIIKLYIHVLLFVLCSYWYVNDSSLTCHRRLSCFLTFLLHLITQVPMLVRNVNVFLNATVFDVLSLLCVQWWPPLSVLYLRLGTLPTNVSVGWRNVGWRNVGWRNDVNTIINKWCFITHVQ